MPTYTGCLRHRLRTRVRLSDERGILWLLVVGGAASCGAAEHERARSSGKHPRRVLQSASLSTAELSLDAARWVTEWSLPDEDSSCALHRRACGAGPRASEICRSLGNSKVWAGGGSKST